MIFATVCHGPVFTKRYAYQVNKVGKKDTVYVLTDCPELFPDCITIGYKEFMGYSHFTYYSKLLFLFYLLEQLKERVNYVDADFLKINFNKDLITDNYSLFTNNVFTYVTEAFWSFPYLDNISDITFRARELQVRIEEIFAKDPSHWSGTPLKRYAETGVGFGEGTAMSALVQEFNIPLQAVKYNKDLFSKKKLHIL